MEIKLLYKHLRHKILMMQHKNLVTLYCIAKNVGGHYVWWSLYLAVIIFGGIDRIAYLKLKFDST